jgi:streptogramin lyase
VDEFTTVGVSQSIGIAWDSEGRLYVASFNGAFVRRFDTEGNDLGLFVSTNLQGPTNIWFDDNGDLMVMDWSGLAIRRFNENGFFQQNVVLGLSEPEGVEFLDNGDILVGNGGSSSVRQYDADGRFVGDFVPSGSGGLVKPNALRFRTVSDLRINAGMNDAWFNPETAGQGLLVVVFPDREEVFVAMFTYDTERPPEDVTAHLGEPGHRWFTAQGPFSGNRAELDVTLTRGGVFDAAEPAPTNEPRYGTMTLQFTDCNNLKVTYDLPGPDVAGEIPMTRIVEDNVVLCEELSALDAP